MPHKSTICPICGTPFNRRQRQTCSRACGYSIRSTHIRLKRPMEERFWGKVKVINDAESCWLWFGAGCHARIRPYGTMIVDKKMCKATEISWRIHYGDFDRSLLICHKCDNTLCIRPDHLFLGTHRDNTWDAAKKGRLNRKLTSGQVIEARRLHESGESTSDLARRFGVAQPTMDHVIHRYSWRHL